MIFKNILAVITIFFLIVTSIPATSVDYEPETLSENYEYYNYQQMTDLLQNLSTDFSQIMKVTSLAKTYGGRDIWMVKISDNASKDEDEKGVLLMGAHHGNEKPSYEVLIYYIKNLLESYEKNNTDDDEDGMINEDIIDGFDNDDDGLIDEDPSEDRVRAIVNNTQIFIIPMVNPDGVEANTRKNCAPNYGWYGKRKSITSYGVDLNRNYGYDWNYYKIRPLLCRFFISVRDRSPIYRGAYLFSENETKAVKQFVENTNISISISYHTFASMVFYPWFHISKPTPDHEIFISIGENMTKINKYELYQNSQIPIIKNLGTLGTSENWLYGQHDVIAFTVELGGESYAANNPNIIFDMCWKHIGVNHYICERSWSLNK